MALQDFVTGLTEADISLIMDYLGKIKTILEGKCVQLSNAERQEIPSVDQGRTPYILAARDITAKYYKELSIDLESREKTARISFDFDALSEVLTEVDSIQEMVSDTRMAVGSECFENAGVVRDMVSVALRKRVPGMEAIWKRINKYYDHNYHRGPRKIGENGNNGGSPECGVNPNDAPSNGPDIQPPAP